jgi:hypothetical protein
MPFDDISEEIRRNPRPYVALGLLAVGIVTIALIYRRMGRERDQASLAKAEAQLKASGLLLASEEHDGDRACGCATGQGFVVAWTKARQGTSVLSGYAKPWDRSQPVDFDVASRVTDLATDASRTRVALAESRAATREGRVRVCEVSAGKWKVLREIRDQTSPFAVALSTDGTRIAHASRREVVVTSMANGKRLFACSVEHAKSLAMHPSGAWLAVCGNPFVLIGLEGAPQVRKLLIGGEPVDSPEDRETLLSERLTDEAFDDEPIRGREGIEAVGFSRDGKWLWCGTATGLRVYDWRAVTRTTGSDLPVAAFSFTPPDDPPIRVTPFAYLPAQKDIQAIVEERDGKGILFGGAGGRLYRLDLATGKTRELVRLPGEMTTVRQLVLSTDGKTVGLAADTIFLATFPKKPSHRSAWQIWSYPRLLGSPE